MTEETLQTEYEFTLPRGYVDDEGTLHREGTMRLANAADEIEPLQNPAVQRNSSYMTIVLLGRVITELGSLDSVDSSVVKDLFVKDLEYLQNMYARINHQGENTVGTTCPECDHQFEVDAGDGTVVEATAEGGQDMDTIAATQPGMEGQSEPPTVTGDQPGNSPATEDQSGL